MGIETAAIVGAGLLGQGLGMYTQGKANRKATRRADQLFNTATGMMQSEPGGAEAALAGFQLPEIPGVDMATLQSLFSSPQFNAGNDALMQVMRRGQGDNADSISAQLGPMLATGQPFDTSAMFAALAPLEQREQSRTIADYRATAPSLGARFGSAYARGEGDLRAQLVDTAAARRAGIQQSSYEAAQGRRLGAGQVLSQHQQGIDANILAAINAMNARTQGQAGTMLDAYGTNANIRLGQGSMNLQALQAAAQAEAARRGQNAQLLGIAGGTPYPQGQGQQIGNLGYDLATLYLLATRMGRQ